MIGSLVNRPGSPETLAIWVPARPERSGHNSILAPSGEHARWVREAGQVGSRSVIIAQGTRGLEVRARRRRFTPRAFNGLSTQTTLRSSSSTGCGYGDRALSSSICAPRLGYPVVRVRNKRDTPAPALLAVYRAAVRTRRDVTYHAIRCSSSAVAGSSSTRGTRRSWFTSFGPGRYRIGRP